MSKRYVVIWFRHLVTDWMIRRRPDLQDVPFVFAAPDHGRIVITAASKVAETEGISTGMRLADAKAVLPELEVLEDRPGVPEKLLRLLGEWCIRFTPVVAINLPDGLILDVSGCAHLWGGEVPYLREIVTRLRSGGYDARAAMADTIGAAWAVARYGTVSPIVAGGMQAEALMPLHPVALRLDPAILLRLQKLGFYKISAFANMPSATLRRRFGAGLLLRLGQALGDEAEFLEPIHIPAPHQERLTSLEPIRTAHGIAIAIHELLEALCRRLASEGKGIRTALLKCYRVDGEIVEAQIGTSRPSHSVAHLEKLFELKISGIEPALGIELFVLDALTVEDVEQHQEKLWTATPGLEDAAVAELLDRIAGKVGAQAIHRFLPQEHYWPERSVRRADSLEEQVGTGWRLDRPRPIMLLPAPEAIEVTAPIPDYPPMLFRYRGRLHHIRKADGPERIEREWWLDGGEHRDYYMVEDESGQRYWLFRSGHYDAEHRYQWFMHGFFA